MLTTGRRQSGAVALLTVVAMLSLTLATATALVSLLFAARHTVSLRLEREIAFRQAETALLDAEADLLAAFADARRGRLSPLPVAGSCGRGPQQGLCSPAPGIDAAWLPWLGPQRGPIPDLGVPVGTFTRTRMPPIPADMAGATRPPRYLIEALPTPPSSAAQSSGSSNTATATFRITALGQGRDPAVRVVLQTHWIGPATDGPDRRTGRVAWCELVPAT